MRGCVLQHRLRLKLTHIRHAHGPFLNTNHPSHSFDLFATSDPRARITSTCAARSALSTFQSRLQWSQTAHRSRDPASSVQSNNMALNGVQKRGHLGHSHGHGHHHHHHDNTFLTSKNKNDSGVRITRIGLYVNLGMAVGKGIGGYAFNSQAYVYT